MNNDLIDCATYHEQYAKGLLAPVSTQEEGQDEYRKKASKHQRWAAACRQASYREHVRPRTAGLWTTIMLQAGVIVALITKLW